MMRRVALAWISLFLILTNFADFIQALAFKTEPTDTSVLDGAESVILDCVADDKSLKINWFKDGSAIKEDFSKYTVLTSGGLRIKPVTKSDAGKYYCKAGPLTSRTATLTVEYICNNDFRIKTLGTAFRGGNFTMACVCPAVPTPMYTWQKDGKLLQSFTDKELVITNAEKTKDDGKYTCTVNSGGRTATSLPHNLDVFNCSPARIVSPPSKQLLIVVKKPSTIKCVATGDPTPVVRWYQSPSSIALTNTSRIKIFSDGALHFTEIEADDAGKYQCAASNNCDNSKTYTTTLVLAKIGKFAPMADILNRVRSTISITCIPPVDSLPPIQNVTWQRGNGLPISTDARFKVNDNTLQIEQAEKSDSGIYTCVAENIAGKATVDVKVIVAIYPEVTMDPVNKTIIEGESVKLECKFSGDPKPKITWEKGQETLPDSPNTKITNSVDGSVLTITSAFGAQSGLYRCSAKLKHVTERTKEARLFVKERIVLEKFGSNKFDRGKVAKLDCRISAGTGPFDIRWSKKGLTNLLPHMKVKGSKLIITNVKMDDSGNYTCHVNNSFSSDSLDFDINIYVFARIVLKPQNVTVKKNGTALFNCKATGIPTPGILWYKSKNDKDWKPIVKGPKVKLLPNDSLLLTGVEQDHTAWYRCMAGNAGGSIVSANAYLQVGTKPVVKPPCMDQSSCPTLSTDPSGSGKPGNTDDHETDNMGKTVGIAVGCAGAYIILVVGLMIYCKGRRARQAKNKLIVNGEDVPLKPADEADNVEVVKTPELSNARQYPRADLEALRTLGSGTYGNVFLAKASEIVEGEASSIVVVQSLTSSDGVVKKDFLRRMEMLSLKHENIAKLLGVCEEAEPMYLISEYPEQGDLKTVMRDSSTPLSPTQKLNICAAVATGMNYLTNHDHVHKDLAARNCLVNKSFQVKVSFLSLNQGTYPKEYYKRGEELIPLRWMAPEALDGDYSDMSDVWSFGILMWEVYTEGILPYEERPDEEVLHSVADDLRLTKPEGCPGKVYKMMEKCWADDKEDRLTFGQLCEDLSEIPRESEF